MVLRAPRTAGVLVRVKTRLTGFELLLFIPVQKKAQTRNSTPTLPPFEVFQVFWHLLWFTWEQGRDVNFSGVWKDFQHPCEGLLTLLHFSLGAGTSMGLEHRPDSSSREFLCKTKAINFCPGQQNGNWCYCQTSLKPAWEELFLLFPFSHISFPSAEVLVYVEISIGREVAREKRVDTSPDGIDPQGEELRSQQSRGTPTALIQGQPHLLFLAQVATKPHILASLLLQNKQPSRCFSVEHGISIPALNGLE